jgi:uncharacterized protein YjiS (DUF1127 family)
MEDVMSVVPLIGPVQVAQPALARRHGLPALFQLVCRAVSWTARELRVRRDMRRLAEFSDHMLRDIGIARADIEGAVRRGRDNAVLKCFDVTAEKQLQQLLDDGTVAEIDGSASSPPRQAG